MKKSSIILLYIAFLGLSTSVALIPTDSYIVGDGHSIDFKSKDPSGSFKEMGGDIEFDENNMDACKFNLKIEVSSISTGNGMQNKKAQTEEWFNAKKYPQIKFKSTKVEKKGSEYNITGELMMKGVTKTVTIPATVAGSGSKLTFKGTFSVNRMDYKIGKKSDVVADVMKINFSVPAVKK
ncbi:MAG: YceI family protein [Flavobacteriales bacterium]|nr:YceI family protein [Flavobacteriales bacterium]